MIKNNVLYGIVKEIREVPGIGWNRSSILGIGIQIPIRFWIGLGLMKKRERKQGEGSEGILMRSSGSGKG